MNIVQTSWLRPFAEGDDALTVKTLPTKTTYAKNEKIDIAGLTLHAKYRDGGEEDVTIIDNTLCTYDFSREGKATVTVSFNDSTVTFEVTVVAESSGNTDTPDPEKPAKKKGCSGSVTAASGIFATAILAMGVVMIIVRRKNKSK